MKRALLTARRKEKRGVNVTRYICVCVCVFKPTPLWNEVRFLFEKRDLLFGVLRSAAKKKERWKKEKIFGANRCVRVFFRKKKSKLCRFVFLPSSWVFIFDFGPRIQFGHLSSSASHKRSLQHFKRRKLRHKKSERIRCSSSFLFAKVGVLDAWTITTRAFTRTRGKGDETLEFCCYTFCARARSLR